MIGKYCARTDRQVVLVKRWLESSRMAMHRSQERMRRQFDEVSTSCAVSGMIAAEKSAGYGMFVPRTVVGDLLRSVLSIGDY